MEDDRTKRAGRVHVRSTRYHHLVEHVQDAVVEFELVAGEPIVRAVNRAFVDVFGYDPSDVRGESLNEWIVPEWHLDEARTLDERTASGAINYQRVRRVTASGLREFLYRGIPYGEDGARTDGFAVYTDLTEISRNERRLQVMNRVLRHNLRNSANVVAGHTTQLLDDFEAQTEARTASAATVEKAANDLVKLTEEATAIQRILQHNPADGAGVDCVPLIQSVASEHRQWAPNAVITTDHPGSVNVKADSRLRDALDSLVENAIEHNLSESPRVRIRVEATDTNDWVTIHVEDDGPRIPRDERDVIVGEAEITSTQHGSGLGLWLTKWTTELFGGELAFDTSEFGGNDVTIRLLRG